MPHPTADPASPVAEIRAGEVDRLDRLRASARAHALDAVARMTADPSDSNARADYARATRTLLRVDARFAQLHGVTPPTRPPGRLPG